MRFNKYSFWCKSQVLSLERWIIIICVSSKAFNYFLSAFQSSKIPMYAWLHLSWLACISRWMIRDFWDYICVSIMATLSLSLLEVMVKGNTVLLRLIKYLWGFSLNITTSEKAFIYYRICLLEYLSTTWNILHLSIFPLG